MPLQEEGEGRGVGDETDSSRVSTSFCLRQTLPATADTAGRHILGQWDTEGLHMLPLQDRTEKRGEQQ